MNECNKKGLLLALSFFLQNAFYPFGAGLLISFKTVLASG
jgi:hypothetical protein